VAVLRRFTVVFVPPNVFEFTPVASTDYLDYLARENRACSPVSRTAPRPETYADRPPIRSFIFSVPRTFDTDLSVGRYTRRRSSVPILEHKGPGKGSSVVVHRRWWSNGTVRIHAEHTFSGSPPRTNSNGARNRVNIVHGADGVSKVSRFNVNVIETRARTD